MTDTALIINADPFTARIEAVVKGAADDLATLNRYRIETAEQFEVAALQSAALKAELAVIEAERKELVGPKNDWVKEINSKAKPATDFLNAAIKLLTSAMGGYQLREEARQQKVLEQVQVKAEAGDIDGANAAIATLESRRPDVAGLSKGADKWVLVSIDESKLPDDFWIPDVKKIEAVVKASRSEKPIPGVVARKEKTFTQKKVG